MKFNGKLSDVLDLKSICKYVIAKLFDANLDFCVEKLGDSCEIFLENNKILFHKYDNAIEYSLEKEDKFFMNIIEFIRGIRD